MPKAWATASRWSRVMRVGWWGCDGWVWVMAAFHGGDDGFGDLAELGQLLAGEFVKDA